MKQTLRKMSARDRIIESYPRMSDQLQLAARYILDHPRDVALVSMRELASRANVQPATMTRLAKFLKYDGFQAIRDDHAATLGGKNDSFAARAQASDSSNRDLKSDALAHEMLESIGQHVLTLGEATSLRHMAEAAETMSAARQIYVLGLRSTHSVAWHFHYVMSLLGDKTRLLDGTANTAGDGLIWAEPGDALLVVSVNPYVKQSVTLARLAKDKGMRVISITDSEVSPLASISDHAILCQTENRSFFHTLAPALAVSEILSSLIADRNRASAIKALEQADDYMRSINSYVQLIPRRDF